MLQNNPLLAQLKQQLHSQTPRAEGIVKAHEKGYGFLETDNKKSYFISVGQMKNVLDGDKVSGVIIENGDKTAFEPETLIEPALNTFLGQVSFSHNALEVIPESGDKRPIRCKVGGDIQQKLQDGDWVKAILVRHQLKDKNGFFAEITQFITEDKNSEALWLIALAKYNLETKAPNEINCELINNPHLPRVDLTNQYFFTIDNAETEDMDDAISIDKDAAGNYRLCVAIADPSAYIQENSEIDLAAYQRAFSTYLPGFTVPMLPKSLANRLCSLKENEKRPALVCNITISSQGDIVYDATEFNSAWIISKAKLSYDNVSDFIDNNQPLIINTPELTTQLKLLAELASIRTQWRDENALLFKDNADYHFIFDNEKQLIDIVLEHGRIANKMVEEAMVIANQAFTYMAKNHLEFAIFNTHAGFEPKFLDTVIKLLGEYQIEGFDKEKLSSFDGYKALRKLTENNELLEYRLRRYQAPADFAFAASPHFGLGFDSYATWTSPIRKYGDLVNHRLIKSMLTHHVVNKPNDQILAIMNGRRKTTRQAEREVSSKLYCQFLANKVGEKFTAQIIDLNRGGMKVRLNEIGAIAFIPASSIHSIRNELTLSPENGNVKINDDIKYQLLDSVNITINEVKTENNSIIAKIDIE